MVFLSTLIDLYCNSMLYEYLGIIHIDIINIDYLMHQNVNTKKIVTDKSNCFLFILTSFAERIETYRYIVDKLFCSPLTAP